MASDLSTHTPPATPPSAGPPPRGGVREVDLRRPLAWLRLGLADLVAAPVPGLAHGLAAAVFGWALVWLARDHFWGLAGAFSGFLIVAPIVATGLYEISRERERGQPPRLAHALRVWKGGDRRLMRFGLLLGLAGTGWVLTSASLITRYAAQPVNRPLDFLHLVVLHPSSWLFEVWLALGALLAAPVFASSVVALPLLLDRKGVSVLQAVLTSWHAVLASPATMALWAALILALTGLGMATLLLGLVVIVPWLGHASWHAYRDIVVPEEAPATSGPPAQEPR
ncbi:MAG: DUF2189 domain-containing protein [Rubrivivax sp.]|nr:DUF2189 domain-containing protein [Rubrivivax sp.]